MDKKEANIDCPTFQKQEPVINGITDKINKTKAVQEKGKFAEELQKETGVLLSCSDYKAGDVGCEACHFIANLRKKTAGLIIKTRRLT